MFKTAIRSQARSFARIPRVNARPMGVITMRFNSTAAASSATSDIKSEIASMSTSTESAANAVAETVNNVASTISPDQIGYFQSLGLAQNWYWPPDVFQHIFEYAHVYTGLPWWGTIAMVTVGMRLAMLPMYYKASDTTAKFSKLQPEMQQIMEDYQKSKDPLDGQKALLRRKKLMAEHNIKYRWLMAPMFGAPFFIGIFSGLNRMCQIPVDGLTTQGLYWFQNLSVADPYLGLQVLTALIYSATFKLGGEMGGTPSASAMKKIMPFLPFIAIPLTMKIPAATCLYFTFNGLLSFVQAGAFQSAKIRSAIGLAPMIKHAPKKNENTIESIRTMFRNINEKAQENARKTKEELEQKRKHELEQAKIEASKFIQRDDSIAKTKKKANDLHASNKGKRVKKGKELRM